MSDIGQSAQELIDEFNSLVNSGELSSELGATLRKASKQFVEERIYQADRHAELGRHLEAIMRYFKSL